MKPYYDQVKHVSEISRNKLKENPPKTKEDLEKVMKAITWEYATSHHTLSFVQAVRFMIRDVERAVKKHNFSYVEALQEVDIKYGYNPETGKWDGSYVAK